MPLQYWKLRRSEILISRQQTALRFNRMATDGHMVGTHTAVWQTDSTVWLNILSVCVCVFGCEAWPDALLGHALMRIKRLGSLRPHQLPSALGHWRKNKLHVITNTQWINEMLRSEGIAGIVTMVEGNCREQSCDCSGQKEKRRISKTLPNWG